MTKVIHQIWFDFKGDTKMEDKNTYKLLKDQLFRSNSDHIYILWNLNEAMKFVSQYYPWYLPILTCETNRNIIKCDFFRYLVIYHFGGIYLDLDFMIFQNLNSILDKYDDSDIILTKESVNSVEVHNTLHNGFLISRKPKEEFFKNLCDVILLKISKYDMNTILEQDVYFFSGTKLIYNEWCKYTNIQSKSKSKIQILPFNVVCNHYFLNKSDNIKRLYNASNSNLTVNSHCEWVFLTINDALSEKNEILENGGYGVIVLLNNKGSLWK